MFFDFLYITYTNCYLNMTFVTRKCEAIRDICESNAIWSMSLNGESNYDVARGTLAETIGGGWLNNKMSFTFNASS